MRARARVIVRGEEEGGQGRARRRSVGWTTAAGKEVTWVGRGVGIAGTGGHWKVQKAERAGGKKHHGQGTPVARGAAVETSRLWHPHFASICSLVDCPPL